MVMSRFTGVLKEASTIRKTYAMNISQVVKS